MKAAECEAASNKIQNEKVVFIYSLSYRYNGRYCGGGFGVPISGNALFF